MQRARVKLIEDLSGRKLDPVVQSPQRSALKTKNSMAPALAYILREVQREIGLDWTDDRDGLNSGQLEELVTRVAQRLGFELAAFERDEILTQLEKGKNEFGLLQELVDNQDVSDIVVTNYSSISVQQGRKNLATDLSFPSEEAFEAYVERLLQKAGTTYSTKKPIADGMIGSFARVHVVHKCLCESGPYLTIRLNRFPAVNLSDLRRYDMAPEELFSYLKIMVKRGLTVMIVGEVGTGKTTLVRALASSIAPHESILVIEDTPEIRLEHPHVRYIRTREINTDGAGLVTSSQCIRAGMRMAMNRIIFGEIRDADAAESFIDVCASGHPGLSTIHARNAGEAIARLELFLGRAQKGVSRNVIYEQISNAVQVIVFVDICKITGKRRIMEVKEIGAVADNVIRQRTIFQYAVSTDGRPGWKIVTPSSNHDEILTQEGMRISSLATVLY